MKRRKKHIYEKFAFFFYLLKAILMNIICILFSFILRGHNQPKWLIEWLACYMRYDRAVSIIFFLNIRTQNEEN